MLIVVDTSLHPLTNGNLLFKANVDDFTCISDCSHPDWEDGSNAYPWFQHVLPQLKDIRLDFTPKELYSYVDYLR